LKTTNDLVALGRILRARANMFCAVFAECSQVCPVNDMCQALGAEREKINRQQDSLDILACIGVWGKARAT